MFVNVLQWPVEDGGATVAIDTFCYKHQILIEDRRAYRDQLRRSLARDAYYLLTLAGTDDGYYGLLPANPSKQGDHVVVDPVIDIPSVLYSLEDVRREFSDVVQFEEYKIGRAHV